MCRTKVRLMRAYSDYEEAYRLAKVDLERQAQTVSPEEYSDLCHHMEVMRTMMDLALASIVQHDESHGC